MFKSLNLKKRLIITYILNVFDWLCTSFFIAQFGLEIEGNSLMRSAMSVGVADFFKLAVVAFFCILLYKLECKNPKLVNVSSWVILGAYSALAIYHLYIIARLLVIFL